MTTKDIQDYVMSNFTEEQFITLLNYTEYTIPSTVSDAVVFDSVSDFLDSISYYDSTYPLMTVVYKADNIDKIISSIEKAGFEIEEQHSPDAKWIYLARLDDEFIPTVTIVTPSMDYRISVFSQYIDETMDISEYDDGLKLISDFMTKIRRSK